MPRVSERYFSVLASWALVLGCVACDKKNADTGIDGGTTSIDGTSSGDGTSSTTGTSESSSSEEGNDGCQTGFTLCGDACVDFQVDDANCGECGTACTIVDPNNDGCQAGACLPSFGTCFAEGDFLNCNEACAAEGRACVAHGCLQGTSTTYTARFADWCEVLSNGFEHPGECNLSLTDFGVDPGGFKLTHGRCCCADPTAG